MDFIWLQMGTVLVCVVILMVVSYRRGYKKGYAVGAHNQRLFQGLAGMAMNISQPYTLNAV